MAMAGSVAADVRAWRSRMREARGGKRVYPTGSSVRIHRRWRHGGQCGAVLRTMHEPGEEVWYLIRLANGAEAWFGREQFDYI